MHCSNMRRRPASNDPQFFVRFQLSGNADTRVESVTRMKVDGRGGIQLYDRENRAIAALPIAELERFSIHAVHQTYAAFAA